MPKRPGLFDPVESRSPSGLTAEIEIVKHGQRPEPGPVNAMPSPAPVKPEPIHLNQTPSISTHLPGGGGSGIIAPSIDPGIPAAPATLEPNAPTLGDQLKNAGLSLLEGSMRFAQAPFSLGSLAGNLVHEDFSNTTMGEILNDTSSFFDTGINEAEKLQSPAVLEAKQAPLFDPKTGEFSPGNINASKITSIVGQAAPQIPLFLATGGTAGAGAAAKASQAARLGATGAAVGGAQVFEETKSEAVRILSDQANADGTPRYAPSQINRLSQQAASIAGARSMPISAVLTALGLIGAVGGTSSNIAKRIGKGILTDAPAEGAEEALQTRATNVALKESGIDPNRDEGEGVAESAILGTVAGAAIGGGVGAATVINKKSSPKTEPESKPDQENKEEQEEQEPEEKPKPEPKPEPEPEPGPATTKPPEPGEAKVTTDSGGGKTVEITIEKEPKKPEKKTEPEKTETKEPVSDTKPPETKTEKPGPETKIPKDQTRKGKQGAEPSQPEPKSKPPAGRKIFRGFGRKNKIADVAGGEKGPIFGEGAGTFFAFKKEHALEFGPEIEEREFDFKNPLFITSDKALNQFYRDSRSLDKNGSPLASQPPEVRAESQANIRKFITDRGYDAVVIEFDDGGVGFDVDQKTGEKIKQLVRTFDIPQVFIPSDSKSKTPEKDTPKPPAENQRKPIPGTEGKEGTLKTVSKDYPVRFVLVEAKDLIVSNHPHTFSKNQKYPDGVQERQYESDKAAQARVIEQAQKFDPSFVLSDTPTPVDGPPVITPDGIVLGGNSRAMSMMRLFKSKGRSNAYTVELKKQSEKFGLPPSSLKDFKKPILVRRVDNVPGDEASLREIGSDLNKGFTAELSSFEKAVSSGKRLSPKTISFIGNGISAIGQKATLREFMQKDPSGLIKNLLDDGILSQREIPGLFDSKRKLLNDSGKNFIEGAILGAVIDDASVLTNLPASIKNKIGASLSPIAKLKARGGKWDITGGLKDAAEFTIEATAKKITAEQALSQRDLFGDSKPLSEQSEALFKGLMGLGQNALKKKFQEFANKAEADIEGQASFFDKPDPEIEFNEIFNKGSFSSKSPEILGSDVATATPNESQTKQEPKPESKPRKLESSLPGKKTFGEEDSALGRSKPGIDRQGGTALVYPPPQDTPEILGSKLAKVMKQISDTVTKGKARPDAVRNLIRKRLGVPVNEGGFRVKRKNSVRLGQFKVKPQTIQLSNKNSIDTLAHEVGHHFSEVNKPVRKLYKRHKKEILRLTPAAYANQPENLRMEEGFAEFFRLYFTQRKTAQLKAPEFSADFNRFLMDTPDYHVVMEEFAMMVADWQGLSPTDRILAKVGSPPWWVELSNLSAKKIIDWWTLKAVSRKDPLVRMVQDLNPSLEAAKDPAKLYQLGYGDSGIVETWLETGRVPFKFEDRLDSTTWGKPLKEILEPIAKDDSIADFTTYLIVRRADELKKVGKENLFSREEIDAKLAEVEAFSAEKKKMFETVASEVFEYNADLTQYAVDGGYLSQEVADKFKVYSAYIPFFRVKDKGLFGGKFAGGGSPFKRLHGGTDNINDPIENILQNTTNIISAVNRNNVMRNALSLARNVPGGGRWAEKWPVPMEAVRLQTSQILDTFKSEGIEVDEDIVSMMAEMQTFFRPKPVDNPREQILILRDEGKQIAMKVNDELLHEALTNFSTKRMPFVDQILRPIARVKRATVVLDLAFMARNFVRDTASAYIQSTTKNNFIPFKDSVSGAKEVLSKSETAKLFKAMGGGGANVFRTDSTGQLEATRKKLADIGDFKPSSIIFPHEVIPKLLDKIERVGAAVENSARVREFRETIKEKGGDANAAVDAAIASREISVDFGDIGTSYVIQALARTTPFFNARVQGWTKTKRTLFGKNAKQAWLRGMLGMTIPALTIALINRARDDFDDLQNWEKNTYLHFKIDGEEFRMPKPWEYGAAFMTLPDRFLNWTIDSIEDKGDREKFIEGVGSTLMDAVGGMPIPTGAEVPIEIWANRSFFLGREIENFAQRRKLPGYRYYDRTSETLKIIGEHHDLSPLKMEHTVRGFFSGLGMLTLAASDAAISVVNGKKVTQPEQTFRDWPVIKIFAPAEDRNNSRAINEFYRNLEEIMQAEATYRGVDKENDFKKLDRLVARKPESEEKLGRPLRRASREMSGIRADIIDIKNSPDSDFPGLSKNKIGELKRKRIAELKREMREIAKETNADLEEELRLLKEAG